MTPSPVEHPDVAHLLDLLELLPRDRTGDPAHILDGEFTRTLYAALADGQISAWRRLILAWDDELPHQLTWPWIRQLVVYLLDITTHPNEQMWKALDQVRPTSPGEDRAAPAGAIGRRWAEDVTATAWRLYVTLESAERRHNRSASR